MDTDISLSLFMPAYNAARHIESTIGRIPSAVWDRLISLWVIDDGSTDGTGAMVETLSRTNRKIHRIGFERNRGYGTAVKEGLTRCREENAAVAVCLHADGQYAPEIIPDAVEKMLRGGIDLLQGSRIASGTALSGGMPLYKYIANRILTTLENSVYRLHLTDYHSGYLFYSRNALNILPTDQFSNSFDFDVEVIAAARARGLTIDEIAVPTRYADEISHVRSIGYGIRVLRVMVNYLCRRYSR
jgi:glycosyltransferase involved in cell wall biosynthesis